MENMRESLGIDSFFLFLLSFWFFSKSWIGLETQFSFVQLRDFVHFFRNKKLITFLVQEFSWKKILIYSTTMQDREVKLRNQEFYKKYRYKNHDRGFVVLSLKHSSATW